MARREDRIFDDYLAAAARAGDGKAFALLAKRFEARLVCHAWRLTGDAEAARDIAQEAWADIARGLRRLDDSAAFPAFAFRIVTRRVADFIRRRKRTRRGEAAYAAEPREEAEMTNAADASASASQLSRALMALSAEQRAAIALFYLEDLSVAEIAAALSVPAGTVKTRLKAARERLRDALGVAKEENHEQA